MNETQVLIVGAGPTGLALALFMAKAGVKPMIIDKNSGPGQASRAMGVQARTLEFYRQLGFADEIVDRGIKIEELRLRTQEHVISRVPMKDFGDGLSPYPFLLSFPQDEHERLLVEKLSTAGIEVQWNTALSDLEDMHDYVRVTLTRGDGNLQDYSALYVVGCDGAHSEVRRDLGLNFPGGTYEKTYYVADVQATGEAATGPVFTLCFGKADMLIVLPIRTSGMTRLIGVIPEDLQSKEDVTFDEIREDAEAIADIKVTSVNWFSRYHVSHRVTEHFQVGRVFVAGDSGHIHSPVGGQGMNTGIGDAINLSWKLAAVVQGRADTSILKTYEPERIAFARSLVATTDRAFQTVTGSGLDHRILRETVLPHLFSLAFGFEMVKTAAFKMISQIRVKYTDSDLSDGSAGSVEGGDRLPWVPIDEWHDNFQPLQTFEWQLHVYGEPNHLIHLAVKDLNLDFHQFEWTEKMEKAGLKRGAIYLVRPDGYVALADDDPDTPKLQEYLTKFLIRPRSLAYA
jgi:2-polyprenyl-6-methoxyphenol hydroxylase-like FAD-dependent oxidoreductase